MSTCLGYCPAAILHPMHMSPTLPGPTIVQVTKMQRQQNTTAVYVSSWPLPALGYTNSRSLQQKTLSDCFSIHYIRLPTYCNMQLATARLYVCLFPCCAMAVHSYSAGSSTSASVSLRYDNSNSTNSSSGCTESAPYKRHWSELAECTSSICVQKQQTLQQHNSRHMQYLA